MSMEMIGKAWDLDLDPADKLLMLAFADNAGAEGEVHYPLNSERISKLTGLSEDHISEQVVRLEKMELIELIYEGKRGGTLKKILLLI